MNSSDPISDPNLEAEAALWAAKLDGSNLGAAEKAELESWLAVDPKRRRMLSEYAEFSADLADVLPAMAATGALHAPRAPAGRPGPLARWALGAALAATAAATALYVGAHREKVETLVTPVGQRQSFTLSDGTKMELNANTRVTVENGRLERRVRLSDGEAFFFVTKDKDRPFIVETSAGSVRVTGTIFNVRTEAASELEVTVVEGSVQVRPGQGGGSGTSSPVALGPGDQLTTQAGGVALKALSPAGVDDALAWRQGKIVCVGMPMSELLARFAHDHGLKITTTPGAAGNTVGGMFGLDDVQGFYRDIQYSFPVRVTQESDGSVRVSLRSEP